MKKKEKKNAPDSHVYWLLISKRRNKIYSTDFICGPCSLKAYDCINFYYKLFPDFFSLR